MVTATYAGQGLAIAGVLDRIFAGRPFGSTVGPIGVVAALHVLRAGLMWWREVLAMEIGGAARAALHRRMYAQGQPDPGDGRAGVEPG